MEMRKNFKSKVLINYLSIPYFFYILFVTVFGRTFNGLFVGPFRLGELVFSEVAKILSWVTPSSIRAIDYKKVAKSMLEKTISAKEGYKIISNKEMHKTV